MFNFVASEPSKRSRIRNPRQRKRTKFFEANQGHAHWHTNTGVYSSPLSSDNEDIIMQAPQVVVQARRTGRRPIDKVLIFVRKTGTNATQVSTTLATASFPCTIVGLRWQIVSHCDAGTNNGQFTWAIVNVKDGNTANAMAVSDGAAFYAPEQEVLCWGVTSNGPFTDGTPTELARFPTIHEGNTKTMRKLLAGDQLLFICKGEASNTTEVNGIIQFFCKT